VVALDESGRPSFNTLQNHGSAMPPIIYYVFDMLILAGKDVMAERFRRDATCSEVTSCRSWVNPSGTVPD